MKDRHRNVKTACKTPLPLTRLEGEGSGATRMQKRPQRYKGWHPVLVHARGGEEGEGKNGAC